MNEGHIRMFNPGSIEKPESTGGRLPLPYPWIEHRYSEWREVHKRIAELLGSPDVTGRQLNGLGGSVSSLSKAGQVTPF